MKKLLTVGILIVLALAGCSTPEGKGMAVGATAGSLLGGVIGHQSGHGVEGAAIGAGVGAVTGAVIANKTATKFCPVCGRQFDQNMEFCPHDGTALKVRGQ